MTANKNFKRQVRARAAKTGESYTAALRHFRPTPHGEAMPESQPFRLAVAQTIVRDDPGSRAEIQASGAEIRHLMREAHRAGARLIHFPEGATCAPNKRLISSNPDVVAAADWDRLDWEALQHELRAIAALAGELRLWTVVGAVHRLTPPHRPHNSLYVINDRGGVSTRYDERFLSHPKLTHMYAPGSAPVTFEVDGIRFGCALGMEVHYPESFLAYERDDVDCVLFSTMGPPTAEEDTGIFAAEARAHAATNSFWVSYAAPAQNALGGASGIVTPDGEWQVRCAARQASGLVVADLDTAAENLARPWRRKVRDGLYDPHLIADDPRSEDRGGF